MSESTNIVTPTGRLVQGDLFKPSTTDHEGNPLVTKSGPNAGQPRVDYFFGIAIPKLDDRGAPCASYAALEGIIKGVARAAFPKFFDPAGNCLLPTFAFKITDGDSVVPNMKGTRPCDREGFPGNWVLGFSSGFAPGVYTSTQPIQQIVDTSQVKRGDYIRIGGTVVGNNSDSKPGVYLNHNMVQFVAHGQEISAGPSAAEVFGDTAPALPAGASATPLASAPMPAPAAAVAPVAAAPAMAAPIAAPAAVAPVALSAVPAPDFLAPPAAVEVRYAVDGKTYTEAELLGFQWTPAQIAATPKA